MTQTATTMDDMIYHLPRRDVDRLRDFALEHAAHNRLAALVNSTMHRRARARPASITPDSFDGWTDADLAAGVEMAHRIAAAVPNDAARAFAFALRRMLGDTMRARPTKT